jgi:membrane protein
LLCDPAITKAQPLVAALLIEPSASLRGFWQRAGFDAMTLNELIGS